MVVRVNALYHRYLAVANLIIQAAHLIVLLLSVQLKLGHGIMLSR